ncbi:MAG: CaiB/BaiF CoA-transferase family protein [Bacteroidia bacterium]
MNETPLLEGLQVLEVASVLAGPAVGMFLAELGAEVVKVENRRTGGDVTRSWTLPGEAAPDGRSAYFCAVNWGKRSLALDLQHPAGQEVLRRLADRADVLLSNFRPGSLDRMGLAPDELLARNPRLIHACITGYGPGDERAAFDAIIQAEAGFTYLNGSPGQIAKMPVALMDLLAAHQLKEALLLALLRRARTGQGGSVEVSLFDSGVASLANQASNWLVAGHVPQPIGSDHPNIVPYGSLFATADGEVVLAVGNDAQFAGLCEVLGLAVPPAFATNAQRVQQREAVKAYLRPAIAARTRADLLAALAARPVPAGAVNSLPEVCDTPAAQALLIGSARLRGLRTYVARGIPTRATLLAPPAYNAHAPEILASLGLDEALTAAALA